MGAAPSDVVESCVERLRKASGAEGEETPVFPNLESVCISSTGFLSVSLAEDENPILDLLRGCCPTLVCVEYPCVRHMEDLVSPAVLAAFQPDARPAHGSLIDTIAERQHSRAEQAEHSEILVHFERRPRLDLRALRAVNMLRERRAGMVSTFLGRPKGIGALMKLLKPETVTLHGFRFFSNEDEDDPYHPALIDPMTWPTNTLRVMAPTVADEHNGRIPDKLCPVNQMGERACACNESEMWERAARFVAWVDAREKKRRQQSEGSEAAPRRVLELVNVGHNLSIICNCTGAYTAAVWQLKRTLLFWVAVRRGMPPERSQADDHAERLRELAAPLALDVRMPHWSEVWRAPCACGHDAFCGDDEKHVPEGEDAEREPDCVSVVDERERERALTSDAVPATPLREREHRPPRPPARTHGEHSRTGRGGAGTHAAGLWGVRRARRRGVRGRGRRALPLLGPGGHG